MDAFEWYKNKKEEHIREIAEKYKNHILQMHHSQTYCIQYNATSIRNNNCKMSSILKNSMSLYLIEACWYYENSVDNSIKYEIDKDILGGKLYSPKTCTINISQSVVLLYLTISAIFPNLFIYFSPTLMSNILTASFSLYIKSPILPYLYRREYDNDVDMKKIRECTEKLRKFTNVYVVTDRRFVKDRQIVENQAIHRILQHPYM
mgnify:CR=1 FL=1